jgi:hypothetical protein
VDIEYPPEEAGVLLEIVSLDTLDSVAPEPPFYARLSAPAFSGLPTMPASRTST